MAVDTDAIYNRFIDAVNLVIGSELAQVPKANSTPVAAVFKSKTNKPTGQYPCVIVDVATRSLQSDWANIQYYDLGGDQVTEIIYDYFVTIAVYGGLAMDLAGKMEEGFVRQDVLNIFCEDNFASIPETFPVTSTTTRIDNQTMDFASFIVKLTTVSRVIEEVDDLTTVEANLKLRWPDTDEDLVSSPFTSPTAP